MKLPVAACLISLLAAATAHAGQSERAIVAAMKLSEASNYSWSTAVDDDARSYNIDGQTSLAEPNDYSLVTMPMIAVVRRRVTRATSNSENVMTAIYSGDERLVIQTPDGWRKPEQLADNSASSTRGSADGSAPLPRGRGRRGMGGGGGGFPGGGSRGGDRPTPAYSNLQLTLSRPHEELGIIIAGYHELNADGDVASGTLSDTAAKLLLVHAGQKEVTPLTAAGTFRLWMKDGVVVKYEIKLEGTIAVTTNGNRREVTVHQTSTTEVKNVGTTKFDVPEEAQKKLGG